MQLAPMRYSRIDGTAVAVTVASAAEAKSALRELRHKKRELKFLRSALVRRQKAARAREAKDEQGRKRNRTRSLLARLFAGLKWIVAALWERATVARAERRARSPAEIKKDLATIDETLYNIDGCILQLEGKLLTQS